MNKANPIKAIALGCAMIYNDPQVYHLGNSFMQVAKWGNSLAVRLPSSVVAALKLREGDDIEIHVASERAFEVKKGSGARELLARLRHLRGRLPTGFRFDRLEANQRG